MAYTKTTWEDLPSEDTPITSANLQKIEDGIEALDTSKVNKADIVDNLTTNDAQKVLSAKQGKALKDKAFQIMCGGNGSAPGLATGETAYFGISNKGITAYMGFVMPKDGTISNLRVYSDGSPGAGQTYTFTMMKNNVAQTLTCQIATGANSNADNVNSFSVGVGDRVSLRGVASASAVTTNVIYSFVFTP